MKRPKGPELKMPTFLADLYHDLRDRRLLPLIALALVAIVATPILIGQKSETTTPPVEAGPIATLKAAGGTKSAELTVVQANPGLRDYRKRLRGRKPTDPFKQRFTKPDLKGTKLGGGTGGEEASSSSSTSISTTVKKTSSSKTTTTTKSEESGSTGGAPPVGSETGNPPETGEPPHAILYAFAVNVTIVHSSGSEAEGNKQAGEPETREQILPTTSLPGKKKQVVTYLGVSPARHPLFLISSDVTGVFGEGKCVTGTGTCQLIELEPGFPEVFEYGESGDRYSIKVTKVEFVVTGHS
jgi:hypothetical protein